MTDSGFLAIWSDVTRERETDYLHWLTREHTSERLGVDGFLSVSVYRARRPDVCRYFIHYELAVAQRPRQQRLFGALERAYALDPAHNADPRQIRARRRQSGR